MAKSDTRDRILDATLATLSTHGLAALSLEDVARAADLSRQTVYRYFGNRDALIRATIVREEEVFLDRVRRAAERHGELRPALEAAIAEALDAAWSHPVMNRLLDTEPDALLPYLTTGAGPVLVAARPALTGVLAQRLPHLSSDRVTRAADVVTRLVVSYTINPPEESAEDLAVSLATLLLDGLKA